jgi:hypothetical protein
MRAYVGLGANLGDREPMRDREIESDFMEARCVFEKSRKNDIPKLIGGQFDFALSLRCGNSHIRVICRTQREGQAESESVIAQFHPGQHVEMNGYGLARPDVADRQIHDAVAVLAGKSRERAGGDASLIGLHGILSGL